MVIVIVIIINGNDDDDDDDDEIWLMIDCDDDDDKIGCGLGPRPPVACEVWPASAHPPPIWRSGIKVAKIPIFKFEQIHLTN